MKLYFEDQQHVWPVSSKLIQSYRISSEDGINISQINSKTREICQKNVLKNKGKRRTDPGEWCVTLKTTK